jgi:hypothetical protein
MLVTGVWHQCDDGIIRPVIQAEILAHDNSWWKAPFLLDTGADRTVLSADVLTALRLPPIKTDNRIGGAIIRIYSPCSLIGRKKPSAYSHNFTTTR